jgi:amino acid transporter
LQQTGIPAVAHGAHQRQGSISSTAKKAGLISFVFVMYSYCTGGPFGLEDMVTTSGPGMSLLYLLLVPFFWSIPMSLVAAELTTAMPVEGGFYRWTRAAFGDFWGFLAGWWNWCSSFLLGGAYAVLFTDYISFFYPQITGWKHYLVALLVIAVITHVNIRGISMVGRVATVLEILILLPVAAMCVMSVKLWHSNPFAPLVPPHQPGFQVFGVGLAIVLWAYAGYEQLSTVAEEVEDPRRNYPRALAWMVPISMATYFLPTACALAALHNWQDWHTGFFSNAAQLIGGHWLGFAMTLAAAITNISLFNSTVLTSTRMPSAMAEDGYMSPLLARIHPKYGTPWVAILVSAVCYAALAWGTLTQLISIYVWLRIATSVLTVLAAWRLRRTQPDLARPFRIPWGTTGVAYAVVATSLMSVVALAGAFAGSDKAARILGPVTIIVGPIAYLCVRRPSVRSIPS